MERPNDHDESTHRRSVNPNVFDDEYAVDASDLDFMPVVADGFRPGQGRMDDVGSEEEELEQAPPRRSISVAKTPDPNVWRMASRGSTTKPPLPRESFTPFHDSAAGGRNVTSHSRGPGSQGTALQHRASISSTGSFATIARSESPYTGGPSHPYGMYPQNTTVARSSSVTTSSTSTTRQAQRSISGQRPTHPYGMYPQNVLEDTDEPDVTPPPLVIPVGFPGLNTGYHRRIGPDGEEQDIVGPDGHTEQLPPYSRYPEEGPTPTKEALAAEPTFTPIETNPPSANGSQDVLVSPGAPQSQRDVREHRSLPIGEALTTPSASEATLNASEQGGSEKPVAARGWKAWRKRRLWGKVPCGVVIILLVLVLVFAIILGAAIGSLAAKAKKSDKHDHKHQPDDPEPQLSASNTMFDATPIPTPSSLMPLVTGRYGLFLGIAQESSPSCLTVANQLSAWSCKMSLVPIQLTINATTPNGAMVPMVGVQPVTKPDGGISYGVQAPTIQAQPLQLVIDQDYPAFGPAFHFQSLYNRVVVLGEDEFAAGAGLRRRDSTNNNNNNNNNNNGNSPPPSSFHHRNQVEPGDSPWYCIWNETFIEGYVYVNDNSSAATMTGSFMSSWPTSYPSSAAESLPFSSPATATSTPFTGEAAATSTTAASSQTIIARDGNNFPHLAPYPRIVKLEERRLPGSPQPFCQKMHLLDNGTLVQAVNAQEQAIVVMLQETDPSLDQFFGTPSSNAQQSQSAQPSSSSTNSSNNSNDRRSPYERRDDPAGACHCQWLSQ